MNSKSVIEAYFRAFNAGDTDAMLDLAHEDLAHHVNEGKIRTGKARFAEFNAHMTDCYRENLTDLVILTDDSGTRLAAEYIVNGTYLKTDPGLPPAAGQIYRLPAGSFFTLTDGKIARITTYYNLADWLAQVS